MDLSRRETRAKLRLLSHSSQQFKDREEAGKLLAEQLGDLRGKGAIVLGIPRGGVVVAEKIAREIDADLDIILARKLGAPGQSELAMGSLAEDGTVFLNRDVVQTLGASDQYIEQEKTRQMAEIQRRQQLIRHVLPRTPLKDRIVVITDDGLATGATMQAALWAIHKETPERLIAAIPVASEESIYRLSADADEIVCLRLPSSFYAVGQFYQEFSQVEDQEVLQILEEESRRRKH